MEMLVYLLGSALKAKVLRELLAHPDEAYHIRGLAARANVDSGNLTKLLTQLVAHKFVLRLEDKRGVAYQINQRSPLYQPLRTVFMAANQLREDLRTTADNMEGAELVLLFGSVAKGTDTPKSDVDILVVGDLSSILAQAAFSDVAVKHNRDVNVMTVSASELRSDLQSGSQFWADIWSHSITLKGNKNAYS